MIDNPNILKDIVAETGVYATHEGAETVIGCLAIPLDEYADKYRVLAVKVWENDHSPDEDKEEAV